MFRLINAVLETPAEQPTTSRIAIALGEVGFLSSVAVGTDLGLLLIIGQFSVPAVREFCTFAGFALVMDFFLHLTYFLAVLSVDVRRLELQDSLDRLTFNKPESYDGRTDPEEGRGKLGELIMQRAMPMSTRIAGSVIVCPQSFVSHLEIVVLTGVLQLICFLVALNMHFLENQSPLRTVISLYEMVTNRGGTRLTDSPGPRLSPIMPINVARTPTAWLKRQDQLTGKELIGIVKPGAYRMVAKAYDPIFFVLRGSSRSKIPGLLPSLVTAVSIDTVSEYMQGFILTIIVVVAAVTLLMNHLLMKDITSDMVEALENEGPSLTCQTLYEGHSLDVVMLATSPRGVVVSVGLDRRIVVWKLKTMWQLPSKDIIRPTCPQHSLWPIIAIALDEKGEWLAIAPRQGSVSIWSIKEATFKPSVSIELGGHQPSAFFFEPQNHGDGPRLIVLRHDGWLSEVCVRTGSSVHHRICTGVVVSCSHGGFTPRLPLRVVTACQKGKIFVTSKSAGEWNSGQLSLLEQPVVPSILDPSENCAILPLPSLGMIVTSRSCNVDLVDLLSGEFLSGQILNTWNT